jgi:hypothetical protein
MSACVVLEATARLAQTHAQQARPRRIFASRGRDRPQPTRETAPRFRKAPLPQVNFLARLRLRPTSRVECPLHSRPRLDSLIDALLTTVKSRLACQVHSYSPSGDIALKGTHRHRSCRPRVNPWLEAFGALLPPRQRRVRGRDALSKIQTFKQNLTLLLQIFRCKYSSEATPQTDEPCRMPRT